VELDVNTVSMTVFFVSTEPWPLVVMCLYCYGSVQKKHKLLQLIGIVVDFLSIVEYHCISNNIYICGEL